MHNTMTFSWNQIANICNYPTQLHHVCYSPMQETLKAEMTLLLLTLRKDHHHDCSKIPDMFISQLRSSSAWRILYLDPMPRCVEDSSQVPYVFHVFGLDICSRVHLQSRSVFTTCFMQSNKSCWNSGLQWVSLTAFATISAFAGMSNVASKRTQAHLSLWGPSDTCGTPSFWYLWASTQVLPPSTDISTLSIPRPPPESAYPAILACSEQSYPRVNMILF